MTEQGLEPRSPGNSSRTISITPHSVPQPSPGKLNVSDGWEFLRSNLNEGLKGTLSESLVSFFFFFLTIHTHNQQDAIYTDSAIPNLGYCHSELLILMGMIIKGYKDV